MTSTELVPVQETVSLPISIEEAVKQWDDYQALTHRLLNETDYQKIGSRSFKKKSAWRKYARAFNISDRVTHEEIVRADDGFPLYARLRVEASHPNGRTAEADHECHVSERCCPAAVSVPCDKRTWSSHSCCTPGCAGRIHWSHPGDLPATALTRAKNRAIADLIGAGEVSAEEMHGQRQIDEAPASQAPVQRPSIPEGEYREIDPRNEAPPSDALAMTCQFCNSPVKDNRQAKTSDKSPDYKCRNTQCDSYAYDTDNGVKWYKGRPR